MGFAVFKDQQFKFKNAFECLHLVKFPIRLENRILPIRNRKKNLENNFFFKNLEENWGKYIVPKNPNETLQVRKMLYLRRKRFKK